MVNNDLTNVKDDINSLNNKIANGLSNPNILINSNFLNPVNQRQMSSCPKGATYWIDRWIAGGQGSVELKNGIHMVCESGQSYQMWQNIEFPNQYRGKEITVSFRYKVTSGNHLLAWRVCIY